MVITEEAYLAHYGILRRSGRYPWGSGGNQNKKFFVSLVLITTGSPRIST